MDETNRILIVDDEDLLRENCKRLLVSMGYECITAENGEAALKALAESTVSAILLDLKMPVMGGAEFLPIAAADFPDTPVIVLTAYGTIDNAVQCMKEGAYDFLTKPFEPETLRATLMRALEKRRLQQRAKDLGDETAQALLDLNTEKQRLNTIIKYLPTGIMVTNRDMEVILHNPALVRLLKINPEMEIPVPVADIVPDPAFVERLKEIQESGTPENERLSMEIQLNQHVLRAVSAPVLGPDRNVFWKVAGCVTVLEDITDFKRLDQMKTDFLNMVAHELRSPLAGIRQLNSVLLEGLAGPLQEKQQDLILQGKRKAEALLGLISDLLDVAKMDAGKYMQHFVPVDIGATIRDIVAFFQHKAEQEGVTLTCRCEELRPVLADPKSMDELFNNLIANAINYSPGGRVEVRARCVGEFVEAVVEDTGVGIAPEELPKIFDKFYRIKHPKTRHVAGTGLGLSIVKGILEAHNGALNVRSEPEKGTCFIVSLPVSGPEKADPMTGSACKTTH